MNYQFLRQSVPDDSESLSSWLYPSGDHVFYAVLNSRDLTILERAGCQHDHVLSLANPVAIGSMEDRHVGQGVPERPFFLYPTRAIRRKNLGELILWSVLAERSMQFAITLAPKNISQRPIYDAWRAFARELDASVVFEASQRAEYDALMASCKAVVSTSVAEGFGLAFLEPWLAGKPLFGRLLKEVCADFSQAGIDLSPLYERIDIPQDWISRGEIERKVSEALKRAYRCYGLECGAEEGKRALASAYRDGCVDFGCLDEHLQRRVIYQLAESRQKRNVIRPSFPLGSIVEEGVVKENRRRIGELYGLQRYGRRLARIYHDIASSRASRVGALDGRRILSSFTTPERFRLLRTQES